MSPSVKTAISIDDGLFREVNSLSRELNISRSKLFTLAVDEFIKKHRNRELLAQINRAYADPPTPKEEKLQEAMRCKQAENLDREQW